MAETHCEVCDQRFAPDEKKALVRVFGGYGYAHHACFERVLDIAQKRAEQACKLAYDVPRRMGKPD